MRLTVAIPTYDRNQALRESIEHLLPQLNDECELLILDNHSNVPVEDSLRDLLAGYPQLKWRIVRHRANLGSAANILRCLELCETEWMWLLGDDDQPSPDAIPVILEQIAAHSDCISLHFGSISYPREESFLATSLRDLVFRLGTWSHLLFMSVGVYNCRAVRPYLRFGYHLAYSLSPHVAVVLAALGDGGSCYFPKESVIASQSPSEWSVIHALLGKMTLLDLPMEDDVRREFARKLRQRPSLEATAVTLAATARAANDWRQAVFQYDQICSRVYYFDRAWLTRVRIRLYRLLVRHYWFGHLTIRVLFPLFNRLPRFSRAAIPESDLPALYQRV
jgi:glycosyltransferase involved in cell wall biosynthesis